MMPCNTDSRIGDTDTEEVQPGQREEKVHQNNH